MSGRENYNKYIQLVQSGVPPYEAFAQAFPEGVKTEEQRLKEQAKRQQKGGIAQLGGLATGVGALKVGSNILSGQPAFGSLGTKLSGMLGGGSAPTTVSVVPSLPAAPGISAGSVATPVMPIPGAESVATTATGGAGSLGVYLPAAAGAAMALNAGMNMYDDLTKSKTTGEQDRWRQLAIQGYAVPEFAQRRLAGETNAEPANIGERAVFFQKYGKDWANASANQRDAITGLVQNQNLGREYRGTYDLRVDPNFEYQAAKILGRDEDAAKKAARDAAAWQVGSPFKTKEGYGVTLTEAQKILGGYGDPESDLRRYYQTQNSGGGKFRPRGEVSQYQTAFNNKLAQALKGIG